MVFELWRKWKCITCNSEILSNPKCIGYIPNQNICLDCKPLSVSLMTEKEIAESQPNTPFKRGY